MAVSLNRWLAGVSAGVCVSFSALASAAGPSAEQALKLVPVQKDVEIDRPAGDEVAKCTIAVEKTGKATGWLVKDGNGRTLRRFLDTNADNVVDLWSYFNDGFEVYRDVDSDFNGKADQCRWLGPGGTRWGVDENEDGKVDRWKQISAEEASYEVVMAIAHKDAARFGRLKLTADELAKLGLSEERAKQLKEQLDGLEKEFTEMAGKQTLLDKKSVWQRFDAVRPGVIPVDKEGNTADIKVYENVMTIAKTGDQQAMVQIGTLVESGPCWRVIDLPKTLTGDETELGVTGFFFRGEANRATAANEPSATQDPKLQKLITELEKLDKAGEGVAQTRKRIELLEQLVKATEAKEDKEQWIRQLADTIGLSIHTDPDSDGVDRLATLAKELEGEKTLSELRGHVEFLWMMADYAQAISKKDADFARLQTAFLANLEKFVKSYPEGADTAEALLQLGMAQELAGQDEEAQKWYTQAVKRFPDSSPAKKSAGAARRLASVGHRIRLSGKTLAGQQLDLEKLGGRVILIDYWATWCEPCKEDFEALKQLNAKYGRSGFAIIGVNLDATEADATNYLKQNRLPWHHLYEPGGLESRFANEMGILTLPTRLLIDANGKVVNRNIHASQIEDEIKKLLDPKGAAEEKSPAGSGAPKRRTASNPKSGETE
jgi:thiol-disulfide isomerase/thioredoxin